MLVHASLSTICLQGFLADWMDATYLCVITERQLTDEGMGIRGFGSFDDLFGGCIVLTIQQVFSDRCCEERGLLIHESYLSSKPFESQSLEVVTIEQNFPCRWIK